MKKLTIREGWIIILALLICISSFSIITYNKHQYNKLKQQYDTINAQLEQLQKDNQDCQEHSVILLNQYDDCKKELDNLKKN